VHVSRHEIFERRGDDLLLRLPISFAEAAMGSRITVPTLEQPVTLKVPPGTESGRILRLRGRGAPRSKGGYGDLLATIEVVIPRKLTRTQRKLLTDFAATEDDQIRAHLDRYVTQESA
jgi:molecular chaperone DnaJ